MASIEKFEDLKVWQKARDINLQLYKLTNNGAFAKDFALKDQVRRASISILSNIAQGFERNGRKEFVQFLSIAKASSGEIRSQLYAALDLEYITKDEFTIIIDKVVEVSKMISGLMNYLQTSEIKGSKFKEDGLLYGKPNFKL